MFLDEETEAALKNSTTIDHTKRIGLWRVVVVRNLPYSDARRNGKVPVQLAILIFSVNPVLYATYHFVCVSLREVKMEDRIPYYHRYLILNVGLT